ncbi:MAG: hypothetical protein ACHP7K_06420 [Actinomycetales bacterium]
MSAAGQVRATALGPWPGTDAPEATRIVRGELGDPHLPHLVQLPARGLGSDAVGRTAAVLTELPVDMQPFGWRLVDRPGADARRAVSALRSDINVLADVAGAEERQGPELKIQLTGPLTLAASLYLHYGERALLDYGARRDIAESLAAGLGEHISRVREAVPSAVVVLQLDEPEILRVLDGTIPTSSGYRTLRSVAAPEVAWAWSQVTAAARAAGADRVVLALPGAGTAVEQAWTAGADGVALPADALGTGDWEQLAAAVEGGSELWLGVLDPAAAVPQVSRLVERVMRPWRGLGLDNAALGTLVVTPSSGLADLSPDAARAALVRLTDTARALNDVRTG